MGRELVVVLVVLGVLSGCLHIDRREEHGTRLLEERTLADVPFESKTVLTLEDVPAPTLVALSAETCSRQVRRLEAKTTDVVRTAPGLVIALDVLGTLVLGAGTYAILDSTQVLPPGARFVSAQVGPTVGMQVGVTAVAAGATALIVGVVNGLRALDSHEEAPAQWTETTLHPRCGTRTLSEAQVFVMDEGKRVPIGVTDATGRLRLSDERIAAALPSLSEATVEVSVREARARVGVRGALVIATSARVEAQAARLKAERLERARAAAEVALDEGDLERAALSLEELEALGGDAGAGRARLVTRRAELEAAAEARRKKLARWGTWVEWSKRPANRALVAAMKRFASGPARREKLRVLWSEEKERNDERERPEDVSVQPLYPEVTGSFSYLKILDRNAGEALFVASDGPFVLRLNSGDSFEAYPGQSVHMTMHTRGETMTMTNGRRFPVFLSGSSPSRVRRIAGFTPDRSRERALQKRLEADLKADLALARSLVVTAEDGSGPLKQQPGGVLTWDDEGRVKAELADDGELMLCVQAGLSCDGDAAIATISSDELGAAP